jgi:hypothetical protein
MRVKLKDLRVGDFFKYVDGVGSGAKFLVVGRGIKRNVVKIPVLVVTTGNNHSALGEQEYFSESILVDKIKLG